MARFWKHFPGEFNKKFNTLKLSENPKLIVNKNNKNLNKFLRVSDNLRLENPRILFGPKVFEQTLMNQEHWPD